MRVFGIFYIDVYIFPPRYIYPAIFSYAEDGISIIFPDFPGCLPCASDVDEAIHNAKEALALHLYGMKEDNDLIPEPTAIDKIKLKPNQAIVLVEVHMPLYREAIENEYVRKNVTLPYWLEKLAEKKGINFSQLLQKSLKDVLGIEEYKHS
ncbi:MAG: type II toxin-antitoxin system HicB family antitoxin [Clostridia bacterium]|nr:type II toxin-antitoxin system HicB family antitoxin [Clostridia bacterium]HOH89471.1 type II toxin-antitoxin system HicB family antitoxin [Bacillota bacterium]